MEKFRLIISFKKSTRTLRWNPSPSRRRCSYWTRGTRAPRATRTAAHRCDLCGLDL